MSLSMNSTSTASIGVDKNAGEIQQQAAVLGQAINSIFMDMIEMGDKITSNNTVGESGMLIVVSSIKYSIMSTTIMSFILNQIL